jgi:hypothetical protein
MPLLFAGGQNCNTFLDILIRIIGMIFGRRGTPAGFPEGTTPSGDLDGASPDFGGDPPGGASVPPADAEELNPSGTEAVRDWE